MGTMLPAGYASKRSLADVLTSCLASISGDENRLDLRAADRTMVIVADGLGAHALGSRSGHARFLSSRLNRATTMVSGFPTTTAAALATLCTGVTPGTHGLVGYRVVDPRRGVVFNQLGGWKADGPDPAVWQRSETVFQRAGAAGIGAFAVGPERYRGSSFSKAVLRGATYVAAKTIEDRVRAVRRILDAGGRSLCYLYIPELDVASHAHGWRSDAWSNALEEVDARVSWLAAGLKPREGALLTADHGVLDVPASSHVLFDTIPPLVDGVRHVAGDPRCLQLHLGAGATEDEADDLAERWRESEGHRSWVATRPQAIAAGWFGADVAPEVATRIGDVLVAARTRIAYYDSRDNNVKAQAMIGQHGSLSPEEQAVPLIGLGAFE